MINSWKWLPLSFRAILNSTKRRLTKLNPRGTIFKWIAIWSNSSIITLTWKLTKSKLRFSINKQKVKICRSIIIQKWRYFFKNWNCYSMSRKRLICILKRMEKRGRLRRISTMKIGWKIWKRKSKIWRKISLISKRNTLKRQKLLSRTIKGRKPSWFKGTIISFMKWKKTTKPN